MNKLTLIAIVILGFHFAASGQSKSTVFIDSVLVVYHNDTLLNKDFKEVHYLDNNKNTLLPIFRNDTLDIYFDFSYSYYYHGLINRFFRKADKVTEDKRQYIVDPCGITVISKKGLPTFIYDTVKFEEKYCYLYSFQFAKTSWNTRTPAPSIVDMVVVNLRLTPAIPNDTITEKPTVRNGTWVTTFFKDTVKVSFKNDSREGQAICIKPNGNYSTYFFENNLMKGEPIFYNKDGEEKAEPFIHSTHYFLIEECPVKGKAK